MKVIIAGSRDFKDYYLMRSFCDRVLSGQDHVEIVSGTARGADRLGERYAKERGYKTRLMPADWDRYGTRAGIYRNIEMADYADGLIAFWNGHSPGTRHMIDTAYEKGLKVRIKGF